MEAKSKREMATELSAGGRVSISSGDDNESSTNAKEVANARPYQRNRSAASAADACRERERMRKTERLKERGRRRQAGASL